MAKGAGDFGRLGGEAGGYGQGDRKATRQKASGAAAGPASPASRHNLPYSLARRSSTRRSRRTIEITQPRTRSQTMAYAANTCQ